MMHQLKTSTESLFRDLHHFSGFLELELWHFVLVGALTGFLWAVLYNQVTFMAICSGLCTKGTLAPLG